MYQRSDGQVVRLLARRRIELPRLPRRAIHRTLVDGEALRPTRVKLQSDVCNLKRLAYTQTPKKTIICDSELVIHHPSAAVTDRVTDFAFFVVNKGKQNRIIMINVLS